MQFAIYTKLKPWLKEEYLKRISQIKLRGDQTTKILRNLRVLPVNLVKFFASIRRRYFLVFYTKKENAEKKYKTQKKVARQVVYTYIVYLLLYKHSLLYTIYIGG